MEIGPDVCHEGSHLYPQIARARLSLEYCEPLRANGLVWRFGRFDSVYGGPEVPRPE